MMWFELYLIFWTVVKCFPVKVVTNRLPDMYWNSTNSIFRIDNTDHIIDVNKGNVPFEYDQVNIICPVYSRNAKEEDTEKYIIYNVSKEEYETCRITNPSPRIIAVCDQPYKLMYFTITFRSFTPQPGGLEFRPGQDYYFISTSSRDDLYRRIGGRCTTHNMKVVFKVCCDPVSQPAHDQANGNLPGNGVASTPSRERNSVTSTTAKYSSPLTTTPKAMGTTRPPLRPRTPLTTVASLTAPLYKTTLLPPLKSTSTRHSDRGYRPKAAADTKKIAENNRTEAVELTRKHNVSSASSGTQLSLLCILGLAITLPYRGTTA